MKSNKQVVSSSVLAIGCLIAAQLSNAFTLEEPKDGHGGPACGEPCCILGKWRVPPDGSQIIALYKQNRVLRLCADATAANITVTVDGGGLMLRAGICSDFEGRDIRIESRGGTATGSYDVVR